MKREIKFRAWGANTKTMIGAESDMWDDISMSGFMHGTGSLIYMQFTGLRDKNGVPIYEGDVVEVYVSGGEKAPVSWGYGCWMMKRPGNSNPDFLCDYAPKYIEVIGNVWENPEMTGTDPT